MRHISWSPVRGTSILNCGDAPRPSPPLPNPSAVTGQRGCRHRHARADARRRRLDFRCRRHRPPHPAAFRQSRVARRHRRDPGRRAFGGAAHGRIWHLRPLARACGIAGYARSLRRDQLHADEPWSGRTPECELRDARVSAAPRRDTNYRALIRGRRHRAAGRHRQRQFLAREAGRGSERPPTPDRARRAAAHDRWRPAETVLLFVRRRCLAAVRDDPGAGGSHGTARRRPRAAGGEHPSVTTRARAR